MNLTIIINEELKLENKKEIETFIKNICLLKNIRSGQFEFTFLSDQKIQEINKQFLNHDYPTDTIAFNLGTREAIDADIYISIETAKSNAKIYQTNYNSELKLYIIHSILHCCGYDDKNPTDKKVMEEEQTRLLQELSK